MAKFSNAKFYDKVWSIKHGWGRIVAINDLTLCVEFENLDWRETFFVDGKESTGDLNPTLFWEEFKLPVEKEKKIVEENKKTFDLVEFLKENLKPKEFVRGEKNCYVYFSYFSKRWSVGQNDFHQEPKQYFEAIQGTVKIVLELNKVTPQQLKQAYKELGWL